MPKVKEPVSQRAKVKEPSSGGAAKSPSKPTNFFGLPIWNPEFGLPQSLESTCCVFLDLEVYFP